MTAEINQSNQNQNQDQDRSLCAYCGHDNDNELQADRLQVYCIDSNACAARRRATQNAGLKTD